MTGRAHDHHSHHGQRDDQRDGQRDGQHDDGQHDDGQHDDGQHDDGQHDDGQHDGHGARDVARGEHRHGRRAVSAALHALAPHSHDPAQSADSALESSADGIRAVKVSLVVLAATAVAQGVVVVLSGSVALLADTVHNLSDALTALPLWLAFALVRRPPSRRYTFGLGRAEDLAGLLIVVMIAVSAVAAGYESIRRLADPQPVTFLWAVVAAGLVGFAGNEAVAAYRIRVGRRIGSAALVADGRHARTDGLTSLGVVVGALGVAAGWPLADPVAGLVITVAIVGVLVAAVRDVGRRLLDGVDPALPGRAEAALAEVAGVASVDEVRLRWVGHRLRGEAVIGVDPRLDVTTAHDIATRATLAVRRALPNLDAVAVHVEPSGVDRDAVHALDGDASHPPAGAGHAPAGAGDPGGPAVARAADIAVALLRTGGSARRSG
jgi:cation diffusion facilitator family transporter